MVRLAGPTALTVLIVLAALAPTATADDDADDTPRTFDTRDHPLFAARPIPPETTRLWAQLSSEGDAYLTLEKDVLPLPYTPPTRTTPAPALTFEAFQHLTTSEHEGVLQYAAREVGAAWDAAFHQDHPIRAEWRLSTGQRGIETAAPLPPILVKAQLVAIDADGFHHTLSSSTARAHARSDARPSVVTMDLPPSERPLPAGSRLIVTLDWTWAHAPAVGVARQPLVTVHPGSFIDLPLVDPVRILGLQDRAVSGDLYVTAQIAHLFGVENLATTKTNILVNGPGVNTQGGRPFVEAPRTGPDGGHTATFDWRLPLHLDNLERGTYDLYVTAGQMHEPGPRVVGTRSVTLDATDDDVLPKGPLVPVALGLAMALVLVAGAAPHLRRHHRSDA